MEKLYGIEALRAEYPHVFELLEQLKRGIAEIEAVAAEDVKWMAAEGYPRAVIDERSNKAGLAAELMRLEIDGIVYQIAKMLGAMPPAPIMVPLESPKP